MALVHPVLDLNLATRPFRNNSLLWAGFGAGILVLLALIAWNVQTYRASVESLEELRSEMEGYDARVQDLRARNEGAKQGIAAHDIDLLAVQAGKANDVIELKAFSWTELFNRLEGVLPYNVRMQRIRPIFRIGRDERRGESLSSEERAIPVVVEGRSQDLLAFLDFESALLASPYFDRVEPERHDRLDNELEFALRFMYYPNRREVESADGDADAAADGAAGSVGEPDAPEPAAAIPEVAVGDDARGGGNG